MTTEHSPQTDVASNGIATTPRPGGVTGKGFRPGQSGNPTGGTRKRREAKAVGEQVRDYLAQSDEQATAKLGCKVTRLQSLIMRLEQTDPRTLLAYAYGKPVELIQQLTHEIGHNFTTRELRTYTAFDSVKIISRGGVRFLCTLP